MLPGPSPPGRDSSLCLRLLLCIKLKRATVLFGEYSFGENKQANQQMTTKNNSTPFISFKNSSLTYFMSPVFLRIQLLLPKKQYRAAYDGVLPTQVLERQEESNNKENICREKEELFLWQSSHVCYKSKQRSVGVWWRLFVWLAYLWTYQVFCRNTITVISNECKYFFSYCVMRAVRVVAAQKLKWQKPSQYVQR